MAPILIRLDPLANALLAGPLTRSACRWVARVALNVMLPGIASRFFRSRDLDTNSPALQSGLGYRSKFKSNLKFKIGSVARPAS